jgi:hypothetical protein
MRITSKTVHDINKMEDNFALRYVFPYPGIISRAELVPSHGASRRRLGEYTKEKVINKIHWNYMLSFFHLYTQW